MLGGPYAVHLRHLHFLFFEMGVPEKGAPYLGASSPLVPVHGQPVAEHLHIHFSAGVQVAPLCPSHAGGITALLGPGRVEDLFPLRYIDLEDTAGGPLSSSWGAVCGKGIPEVGLGYPVCPST